MKKFIGTRLGVALIAVITCMLICSTVAYAAGVFTKDVPATASIKATTPGLTLYTSATYTTEVTSLNFGNINSGESRTIEVFIKNTGNKGFSSITVTSNLDSAVGTITVTGLQSLPVGNAYPISITLNTLESAVDIESTPTVTFSGNY